MTQRIDQEYLNEEPVPVVVNCPDPCCPTCGPTLRVPVEGFYAAPETVLLPAPGLGEKYNLKKFDLQLPATIAVEDIFAEVGDFGTPNAIGLRAKMQATNYAGQPNGESSCSFASQELGEGINLAINAPLLLTLFDCAGDPVRPAEPIPFKIWLYFAVCDMEDCEVEYILPEPPPVEPCEYVFPKTIGFAEFPVTFTGPGVPVNLFPSPGAGYHYVINRFAMQRAGAPMTSPFAVVLRRPVFPQNAAIVSIDHSIPEASLEMRDTWEQYPGVDIGENISLNVMSIGHPTDYPVACTIILEGCIVANANMTPDPVLCLSEIPRAAEQNIISIIGTGASNYTAQILPPPPPGMAYYITGFNYLTVTGGALPFDPFNPGFTHLQPAGGAYRFMVGERKSFRPSHFDHTFPATKQTGAVEIFIGVQLSVTEQISASIYYFLAPDTNPICDFGSPT